MRSDYPRGASDPPLTSYKPDRVVAVVRIVTTVLSSALYFQAFYHRWSVLAPPGVSIFAWAPPLGEHLTSQMSGLVHGCFVGFALWYGRGWGFAYALLTCLSVSVLGLFVHSSPLSLGMTLFVHLPTFIYCGLRLFGTLGPTVDGLELRRPEG